MYFTENAIHRCGSFLETKLSSILKVNVQNITVTNSQLINQKPYTHFF